MKLEVTRDVVSDLWPLCRSGDASADSNELVEAFLAADRPFATELEENVMPDSIMPKIQLSPDAELRLLEETQKRARLKLWVQGGAIALAGFILLAALSGAMVIAFAAH